MAFINVIIPTCDRAETLYSTIKTCLDQDYDDYKIWVSNNQSQDNTEEVVKSFNDSRIVYLETPKKLIMSDSWEYAIDQIDEGFVTIQGSDDGILPNALSYVASLLKKYCVDALVSYPVMYNWASTTINFYNDKQYFLVNSTELIKDYVKVMEYSPEFWLSPTLYHNFVSIDVINKIKKRDKRLIHSYAPDVYSNMILLPEIDRYIMSYFPFCIDGVSKKSSGLAQSSTQNVDDLTKKTQENLFGKKDEYKLCHPKLESKDCHIKSWPYSLVVAEPILQAGERNKEIPTLDIKELLKKIVFYDSYRKRFNYDDSEIMLQTARDVANLNGLDDYVDELIKNRHFEDKDYTLINKFHFNNLKFVNEITNKENVYDLSKMLKEVNYYNLNDIYYKPLIINSKIDLLYKNDIVMNSYSNTTLNKRYNNVINEEIKGINFLISFDWEFRNTDTESYLILKKDTENSYLPEKYVQNMNSNLDQIWVSNNYIKNIYEKAGIDKDKIFVTYQGIDHDIYKKISSDKKITKKDFKFLYVGDLSDTTGIYTLINSYIEEFNIDDSVSLIIKNNWKGDLLNYYKLKDYISDLQSKNNLLAEIILYNDNARVTDIVELYSYVDCLVYPFEHDNICSQVIEAMSCELPVIASDHSCIREYCNEKNSILLKGEIINIQALENELENEEIDTIFKINTSDLRKSLRDSYINKNIIEMGKESRKIIEKKFTWDKILKHVDDLIISLNQKQIFRINCEIIKKEWLEEAFKLFNRHNYMKSEELFKKLVSYDNNSDYYYNLGLTQFKQKKYQDAVDSFANSLETGICTYDLAIHMAKSLDKINDTEMSALFYDKAEKLSYSR